MKTSIIKCVSKRTGQNYDAVEFTGKSENCNFIEKWTEQKVSIRGVSLPDEEKVARVTLLGNEIDAVVGTFIVGNADNYFFVSRKVFLELYDVINGSVNLTFEEFLCEKKIVVGTYHDPRTGTWKSYFNDLIFDRDDKDSGTAGHIFGFGNTPEESIKDIRNKVLGLYAIPANDDVPNDMCYHFYFPNSFRSVETHAFD